MPDDAEQFSSANDQPHPSDNGKRWMLQQLDRTCAVGVMGSQVAGLILPCAAAAFLDAFLAVIIWKHRIYVPSHSMDASIGPGTYCVWGAFVALALLNAVLVALPPKVTWLKRLAQWRGLAFAFSVLLMLSCSKWYLK